MNEKKFNQLLGEFHRSLKHLNNFTEETVKTYISCIQKYERFAKEKLNIDLLRFSSRGDKFTVQNCGI